MIDLRHPLIVLSKQPPWAAIEAAVAPKLAHRVKPTRRVAGVDLAGAFDGEFGGGVSPAGRPRLPIGLMIKPLIVRTTTDHRMERCCSHGAVGDALHPLSCAVGNNIRWLLRAIAHLGVGGLFCALSAAVAYAIGLLQAISAWPASLRSNGTPRTNTVPVFKAAAIATAG